MTAQESTSRPLGRSKLLLWCRTPNLCTARNYRCTVFLEKSTLSPRASSSNPPVRTLLTFLAVATLASRLHDRLFGTICASGRRGTSRSVDRSKSIIITVPVSELNNIFASLHIPMDHSFVV
ncbi:hypothetical protein IF2G_10961 [Cordyceps javanica]|nr:hypothetical protein IF2G_10961 [Cordyceps javanica]